MTRTDELDLIADTVIDQMGHDDYGEGYYFGLDGKRPFGFSGRSAIESHILETLAYEPEGDDGSWSDGQCTHAMSLWEDLLSHIKTRWKAMRESQAEAALNRRGDR